MGRLGGCDSRKSRGVSGSRIRVLEQDVMTES